MNKKKLLKKFKRELLEIDRIEKYSSYFRLKYNLIKFLLKMGILIDYGFPFVLYGIGLVFLMPKNDKPFVVDDVNVMASRKCIETSYGENYDIIDFNSNIDNDLLVYSNSWCINADGLYERSVISYDISVSDIRDKDSYFNMSKEELDYTLSTVSVDNVIKKEIDEEDKVYFDDVKILILNEEVETSFLKKEDFFRNFSTTLSYLFLVIGISDMIIVLKKDYIRKFCDNTLERLLMMYQYLDNYDNEDFEKVKGVRRENLDLLEDYGNTKKLVK